MIAEIITAIKTVPPFTRFYIGLSFAVTVLCHYDYLSPATLHYDPSLLRDRQFWRVYSSFFFFGSDVSLDSLFHFFFLYRHLAELEQKHFEEEKADFFVMVLFVSTCLVLVGPLFHVAFLSQAFVYALVQIWGRLNRFLVYNLFGVAYVSAAVFPYVMLLFNLAVKQPVRSYLLGICVGQFYYFNYFLFHKLHPSRKKLLRAPRFLQRLMTV